jgi:hypothetical protein
MKEKALKLADDLAFQIDELPMWTRNESAEMIRKLVEELDHVNLVANHYEFMSRHLGMIVKERAEMMKPLSDAEIDGLAENCWYTDEDLEIFNYKKFAVLLQERHGIK